jgi:hypothetical protein
MDGLRKRQKVKNFLITDAARPWIEKSRSFVMAEEGTNKQGNGENANGQQAASKTVAPKGVLGSNPNLSAPLFKCNLYLPNGMIRPQISPGVHSMLARKWGDIIRCVPSNRWSTMDDIANLVWDFEKKSYLKDFSRTRKQIEEAIAECIEAGVVLER